MKTIFKNLILSFFLLAAIAALGQETGGQNLGTKLENLKRVSTTEPLGCTDFTILDGVQYSTYSRLAVIQHHGSDNMFMLLDGAGKPLAFAKNNFIAYISPEHSGKLVSSNKANVAFDLSGGKFPNFAYSIGIDDSKGVATKLNWDPKSFSLTYLPVAEEIQDDSMLHSFLIRTQQSRVVADITRLENSTDEINLIGLQSRPAGVSQAAIFFKGIPQGLELENVDVDSVRGLSIPFDPNEEKKTDPFDEDILKDEKRQEVSKSLGKFAPCNECVSQWILTTRMRRLQIAEIVATNCIGGDVKRGTALHEIVQHRKDHLIAVAGKLAKSIVSLDTAQKELDHETDPVIPFCSVLSDEEYVSFAIQYLSSPQLFGMSDEAREVESTAVSEIARLKVNKSAQFLLAKSCLQRCRTMESTDDDRFATRLTQDAALDQYVEIGKALNADFSSILNKDQALMVGARCAETARKYSKWCSRDGQ